MKTIRILFVSFMLLVSFASYAETVNINTADAKTLAKNIKGIGVKKAKAIVTYRDEHGRFSKVEELSKVKGIGTKLVEKNKASLFVDIQQTNLKNK